MKILYGVQASGNGHVARARAMLPALQEHFQVDLLVSGNLSEIKLPIEPKFKVKGLDLAFGKNGGIDYSETLGKLDFTSLLSEIKSLDISGYALIISDYEPISAWAGKLRKVPVVHMSNQASLIHSATPKPKKIDPVTQMVLKNMAPAKYLFPITYLPYSNQHFQPLIRQEIQNLEVSDQGYYLVYLPAYSDDKVYKVLKEIPSIKFKVFTKKSKIPFALKNCHFQPISEEPFLKALAGATGVISAGGFALSSEVLYMNKKLLMVPMKGQYEQKSNAHALAQIGVTNIPKLKKAYLPEVKNWIENGKAAVYSWRDPIPSMIEELIKIINAESGYEALNANSPYSYA